LKLAAAFTVLKVAIGDAVLGDIKAFNAKLAVSVNSFRIEVHI